MSETPLLRELLNVSDYRRFLRRTGLLLKPLCKRYHLLGDWQLSQQAEISWVRLAQMEHFKADYKAVSRDGRVGTGSRLAALDPFMDEDRLLRVGGRLQKADLPYDVRHPVILPSVKPKNLTAINESIVTRIIYHSHCSEKHAGADWLLHHLRTRYWILTGKRTVLATINKCVTCKKAVGAKMEQKMAPLPEARLNADLPWTSVGVDYTGSFALKPKDGQQEKIYVCLFTCLTTRAIHLECCSSLTTDEFILALRRMMGRRGMPKEFFSDQAKTFVRANKELATLHSTIDPTKVDGTCESLKIDWHFNVPFGQHRGGCWERLVRTLKDTLRKCLTNTTVDKTTFETIICEIEAFVNDRPLTVVSGTPTDVIPITPSMLCGARKLRSLPDWARVQRDNVNLPIRTAWKQRLSIKNQCWARFRKDYLFRTLTQVPAWREEKPSLKVGDVVMVSTEASKRANWPLARVTEVEDGRPRRSATVRTVTLRLASGQVLRRPIQHLVHLECG